MESVRLPNNAELERWCRAKILAALDQAVESPDQSLMSRHRLIRL